MPQCAATTNASNFTPPPPTTPGELCLESLPRDAHGHTFGGHPSTIHGNCARVAASTWRHKALNLFACMEARVVTLETKVLATYRYYTTTSTLNLKTTHSFTYIPRTHAGHYQHRETSQTVHHIQTNAEPSPAHGTCRHIRHRQDYTWYRYR